MKGVKLPTLKASKEELEKALQKATSLEDCVKLLGFDAIRRNVDVLQDLCSKYSLTVPNYHKLYCRKGREPEDLSRLLKKGSVVANCNRLKIRLIKEGLLIDRCHVCGSGPEWRGKPLTLQLEHLDGDHFNNLIENLEVICPNCHAQTPTFGKGKLK